MKKKVLISVISLCIIGGCISSDIQLSNNEKFVKQWGNENFDKFRGYSVTLRSYDIENNPIILVYKNPLDTGICGFPFRVIVNKSKNSVLLSSRIADSTNSCSIDSMVMIKLAVDFCKYDIANLSIDSSGDVLIKTEFKEKAPSLIKLNNEKNQSDKKWKHLAGNWFESKNK